MLLCCSCDNCVSTLLSQVWRSSHSKLLCAKDGFFWSWLGGLTGKKVENTIESFKSYLPHTDLICSPHPCPLIKTLREFDSITWGSKLVSVIEAIRYFTAKHHNQLIKYFCRSPPRHRRYTNHWPLSLVHQCSFVGPLLIDTAPCRLGTCHESCSLACLTCSNPYACPSFQLLLILLHQLWGQNVMSYCLIYPTH